jgi:hypothetical protein
MSHPPPSEAVGTPGGMIVREKEPVNLDGEKRGDRLDAGKIFQAKLRSD